jgi:tetratricopeptide (TPR) repeat protein
VSTDESRIIIARAKPSSRGWAPRARDAALSACLVIVPLAFVPGLRGFLSLKTYLLELLVGLAALASAWCVEERASWRAGLVIAFLVLLTLADPDIETLGASAYLVAWVVLVSLLIPWSRRAARDRVAGAPWILWIVGVPVTLALVASLLQGVGIGVLPATRAAFGGVHGVLVGTVGNPTENVWYLLLAALLFMELTRGPSAQQSPRVTRSALAFMMIAATLVIIILNRARAGLLVLALLSALWAARQLLRRRISSAWKLGLGLGLIATLSAALALGLTWGGLFALEGRRYLAAIDLAMIRDSLGIPAGPGAFAREFPGAQADYLAGVAPALGRFYAQIDHAHLDFFELLYELGAPAIFGFVALAVMIWRNSHLRSSPALLAGCVLMLLGYPLFAPASALMLALALALALARAIPARRDQHSPRLGASWQRRAQRLTRALLGLALLMIGGRQLAAEWALSASLASLNQGERSRGRDESTRALALWPGADALFFHANFEVLHDRPEAAITAYERSFELRPRPETAANLATTYAILGRPRDAARWRQHARRLGPPRGISDAHPLPVTAYTPG